MKSTDIALRKKNTEVETIFEEKLSTFDISIHKVKKMLNNLLNLRE